MKRCPQCYEVYDDEERFCEADGQELLADPAAVPEPPSQAVPATAPVAVAGPTWVPAAMLGVLIGIGIGASVFAAVMLSSGSKENEPQVVREAPREFREPAPSLRATVEKPEPTAEPEESPSPEAEEEEQAEAEASPQVTEENKAAAVAELNQGPISTGKKAKANESELGLQTVIEMTDGSTLDVDAAWEDKQGIWYRRSGLVSFVESSRVKAITARKGVPKTPELQDR